MRQHLCELAEQHGEDLSGWSLDDTFVNLDKRVGLPLMLNHADTIQPRLGEAKRRRKRVRGQHSLPNVAVNWKRLWS